MVEKSSKNQYYTLTVEDSLKELKSNNKGLTKLEAENRLQKYGLNELKAEKGISPWRILWQQFSSPLIWLLLFALVVSFLLKEFTDAGVIAAIVLINAILGFIQEYKSERAIEALQRMASQKAKVIRGGQEIKIESKFLVPGDILILETGDKIPADSRLIEVHSLESQEAPLTGESQPVTKINEPLTEKTPLADRTNMVYTSTIVSKGRAIALIVSTGMNTEVGKIASMIKEAQEVETPLQKKLRQLGKYLTIAVIIVAVMVFFAGILAGQKVSVMFLTAIALAVARIPEGLPAVITISLSLGVQRMVKRNALIRRLPSVETLGSVNVICTDKTGTLTHNQMTIVKIWANNQVYEVTGSGYEAKGTFIVDKRLANPEPLYQLLKIGMLCNDAKLEKTDKDRNVIGDPTEAALIVSAEKAGFKKEVLNKEYPRVEEIPFTSERKMMSTLHKNGKESFYFTKGAPDLVIENCDRILINNKVVRLDRNLKKEILTQTEGFAKEALRVLAFAYNEGKVKKEDAEKGMIFVGLQAMIDPPREEVKDSIKKCQDAGIKVIMITGDHIVTASAIAAQLGISGRAVQGKDLDKINLDKEIMNIGVFARVNPEHKLDIVKSLKKKGFVVAMTGDGVNDAPALKKADIGISMGITGTDVAKEASDMILLDDNFTSIVNAIEEGRGIFDNIKKFVNYLLSSNLGEIATILFATLAGLPLPLTAVQILWVNLVTDGLPATALSLDPAEEGIMKRPPHPAKESILNKELRWYVFFFGGLIGICTTGLFWLYQGSGILKAQTIAFTSLVVFEVVRLTMIRRQFKIKVFSNKWLWVAISISILLQLVVLYTPLNKFFDAVALDLIDWVVIISVAIGMYIVGFVVDLIRKKIKKRSKK